MFLKYFFAAVALMGSFLPALDWKDTTSTMPVGTIAVLDVPSVAPIAEKFSERANNPLP